jgi:Terpene synthase family 2, C-terminal metal binding
MENLQQIIEENLYMPFAFAENLHQAEAADSVHKWLTRYGIMADPAVASMIEYTRPAQLASYNSATVDLDILRIITNQIAYQFVYDDRAEDVGRHDPVGLLPMLSESIEILRDDRPASTALGMLLADLYGQVEQRCTPAQTARWRWHSREYVHGLLHEAVAQTRPEAAQVDQVLPIRALTAGVRPFFPLYEAAQANELSVQEICQPAMRRLERLAANAAVWVPDLFSAVKEQHRGGVINVALAHQRQHDISLPEATRLAIRRINQTIHEFEAIYIELKPQLSSSAVGYVEEGLVGWIRGCYYWSRTVPRYAATTTTEPAGSVRSG